MLTDKKGILFGVAVDGANLGPCKHRRRALGHPSGVRPSRVRRFGSHRLRHTTAADPSRQGASLEDVAQMLRHRNIDTPAPQHRYNGHLRQIDLGALVAIAALGPEARHKSAPATPSCRLRPLANAGYSSPTALDIDDSGQRLPSTEADAHSPIGR